MRVITGSARGRRLKELEGMETRPTTDRVKEGLFNVIQFDIEGRRVLDLFAGTGQLGIECLSRGAASAVFVDRRADAVKLIKKAGGVAVLAHPLQYGFGKSDLDMLAKTAKECGVTGMEIYYSGYTQNDIAKLFDLAEKYTLLPTGGSDFHGDNKPGISIGTGDGKLAVPAYFLIMLARSQSQ